MRLSRLVCCLTVAISLLVVAPTVAQETGVVVGTLTDSNEEPLNGVTVVVSELDRAEISNAEGRFRIAGIPPGTYEVTMQLGDNLETLSDVEVTAGETTDLTRQLPWEISFAETLTVYSASRRQERIVEAPASVSLVTEEQIEREAAHGQLAKALEFTPGAEVTQSGLYDFNVNTRGFNSSLNRRVPVLVDGRDPSVPFLMSVDWPALSSLGDVATMELVRGPSSALYGTNAFNGVLNITTKQPRFSQGGMVRLVGGEPSTARGDVRWAGDLGNEFYVKVLGSYTETDDFYVARTPAVGCTTEYAGLPCEAVPPVTFEDELSIANVRLDKYFGENVVTVEGGTSTADGPVIQTGIGRVQVIEQDRPFGRFNVTGPHYNLLAWYNERDAPRQLALSSGRNLVLDSRIWSVEGQVNTDFADQKGRVVLGASYRDEEVETDGTLTLRPVGAEREAVYTQVDYSFTDKFKAVAAARWDDSTLHDDQVSPKAGLVFSPTPNQTLRFTYNEAFQSPNYSEFFLAAPAGAPANLAAAAAANPQTAPLAPFLAQLGFDFMEILARGNEDLTVEEITSWEVGYSGIIGGKLFLTADYYNSELENFVTDLLPGVNPAFPQYSFPIPLPPQLEAGLSQFLMAALMQRFVGLTNQADGTPALVFSYTNAGVADTQGVDLGVNWYFTPDWTFNAGYSWFDFDLEESLAADRIEPNAPEHKFSLGLSYAGDRWDGTIAYRWVDDFQWAAGIFAGPVPSYEVVNLVANYHITEHISIGANVANLFDDEHYEAFGGDLLERRALGQVQFRW